MISGSGLLPTQSKSLGWPEKGTDNKKPQPLTTLPRVNAQIGPRPQPHRNAVRARATRTHNPIAHTRWTQLLGHIRPHPGSLHPLDIHDLNVSAKQLIQLGNHLLSLQDELSRWPINRRHDVHTPSRLVIYQEEDLRESEAGMYWTPPTILRYIETPNNNRRWLQRPWRFLANLTQQMAREEENMSLKIPLQAAQGLMQLLSFGANPDLFDLERTCKKGATILHNHIQGTGLVEWSPAERNALARTASRHGFDIRYSDELSDYAEGLFNMLEQVASALAESGKTRRQTPIKLGIASRLPDGRQLFHDLSELFPGGSLTAARKITPIDRERLEKLLHQSDTGA